ncbi:MAG: glycosyltransferase family 9 protein [bacterium]
MKEIIKPLCQRLFCVFGVIIGRFFTKEFKKEGIRRILLIQWGGVGDLLRVIPTALALQKEFKLAEISILTECSNEVFDLFDPQNSIFSEKIKFSWKTKRGIKDRISLIKEIRRRDFNMILNFSRGGGTITDALFTYLSGASYRIGFSTKEGGGFLYTTKLEFKKDKYILEQNLDLIRAIGVEPSKRNIEVCIPEDAREFVKEFFKNHSILDKDLKVIISPGVDWGGIYRCWGKNKFAQLSKCLIDQYNAKVIIVGSTSEKELGNWIVNFVENKNLINLVGQTTLTQLAALIRECNLFIGNDSGPLHIAGAVKTKAIGIFGPTNPDQVYPASSIHFPVRKDIECSPCYWHQSMFFKFKCKDVKCLDLITVTDVLQIVEKCLEKTR